MMESNEELRDHIVAELEEDSRHEVVWQKAMALTGGSEANAREKYITLRIQQIERELRLEKQYVPRKEKGIDKSETPESSPFPAKLAAVIILLLIFVVTFVMYQTTEPDLMETVATIEEKTFERNQSKETAEKVLSSNELVKLTVISTPEAASIAIVNIKAKYYDGIELKKGKYEIRVSQNGYQTKRFWIDLGADEETKVRLDKVRYRLYIEVEPRDAAIKIMNIKEQFTHGMQLDAGKYHVVIKKEGYKTHRRWIDLQESSQKQSFKLKPVYFLGTEGVSFSEAYRTCLDKDLLLPSVERLRKEIQLKNLDRFAGKWFWTSEKSGVVTYKVIQNDAKLLSKDAKLSSKRFVYCVE